MLLANLDFPLNFAANSKGKGLYEKKLVENIVCAFTSLCYNWRLFNESASQGGDTGIYS